MSHTVLLDQTRFSLNSEESKALLPDLHNPAHHRASTLGCSPLSPLTLMLQLHPASG